MEWSASRGRSLRVWKTPTGFGRSQASCTSGLAWNVSRSFRLTCGILVIIAVGGAADLAYARARVARVTIGRPTIMGDLSDATVRRVFTRHRRELQTCYEDALQKDATLSGDLDAHFMIEASGLASRAEAAGGSLKDTSVATCVLSQIGNWQFHGGCCGGSVLVKSKIQFDVRRRKSH